MHRPCFCQTTFPPSIEQASQRSATRILCRGPGKARLPSPLEYARGWSAVWRNQQSNALRGVDVPLRQARSPHGAPSRLFCPRDRASGRRRKALRPTLSRQLSPPFIHAASSHSRRPHVVGADGDPGPPGGVAAKPRPRAPHPAPPVMTPHESALWWTEHIGL